MSKGKREEEKEKEERGKGRRRRGEGQTDNPVRTAIHMYNKCMTTKVLSPFFYIHSPRPIPSRAARRKSERVQ